MQPGFYGCRRQTQYPRRFLGGQILKLSQHEYDSVFVLELRNRLLDANPLFLLDRGVAGGVRPVDHTSLYVTSLVEGRHDLLQRHVGVGFQAPPAHQRRVDRDPVHPGPETGIAAKVFDFAEDGQEYILSHLLRIGFILQHRPGHAIHVRLVALNQQLERPQIAFANAVDQLLFIGAGPRRQGDRGSQRRCGGKRHGYLRDQILLDTSCHHHNNKRASAVVDRPVLQKSFINNY